MRQPVTTSSNPWLRIRDRFSKPCRGPNYALFEYSRGNCGDIFSPQLHDNEKSSQPTGKNKKDDNLSGAPSEFGASPLKGK